MSNKLPSYAQLIEYYQTTNGLYMIDRDPHEVDIDWIRENAFKPKLVDHEKLTEESKDAQDDFLGEKYLREKLVFSLINKTTTNTSSISDIADDLCNYIINSKNNNYERK